MKKASFLIISSFIFFSCSVRNPANADWINLSGAENAPNIAKIHIHDDHVKIELEISVDDMVAFDHLIPDAFFEGDDIKREPLAERIRQFSNESIQIIADEEEKLQATLKLDEPRLRKERPSPHAGKINPYTGQMIPGPPEDKRVLYAELVYPFSKKPTSLTIIPPLTEQGISEVPIGFMTYHNRVPVNDFKYLSESSTATLDWDDPWYSEFDKKALKRWQRGGVMSFLYIEPYEVRHEILARVKDLEGWIDLGLRGNEFIEADENEQLKKRVGEFLLKRDNVLIDGKQLRPILDRTSFVKFSMTGSTFLEQAEQLPVNTAMVGVIITYLTEGIPQEVRVNWELFSDRIKKVPTNAIDPAGPFPSYVTPDDNEHIWTNFLNNYKIPSVENVAVWNFVTGFSLPVGSVLSLAVFLPVAWLTWKRRRSARPIRPYFVLMALLIAGTLLLYPYLRVSIARPAAIAPKLTIDEVRVILHSLLKNVYRSFDFREEEDVYDKLAVSTSGDILADIYLQNRKSFEVKRAGGAQAKVKKVEILDVSASNIEVHPPALCFRCKWTAFGTVGHWGHIHPRENQYEAFITVEPVDGAWKITNLELLEEKRIDPYTQKKS